MIVATIFISCLVGLFLIDFYRGAYSNRGYFTMKNMGVNLLGTVGVATSRPLVALVLGGLLTWLFPDALNFLADANVLVVFIAFILVEDYLHYWLHRLAHTNSFLWKMHKVHHTPDTIDVTVSNRNPFIWWCIIPNTWLGAMVVWAGMPEVVAITGLAAGVVSLFAHTNGRWDLVLFKNPVTYPFMWIVSRVISVPDTHHYHHNLEGGNTNFAALFMFWDLIHGTAKFPHRKVEGFGLYHASEEDHWFDQLIQPLAPVKLVEVEELDSQNAESDV